MVVPTLHIQIAGRGSYLSLDSENLVLCQLGRV